jgi:hypothetical protein
MFLHYFSQLNVNLQLFQNKKFNQKSFSWITSEALSRENKTICSTDDSSSIGSKKSCFTNYHELLHKLPMSTGLTSQICMKKDHSVYLTGSFEGAHEVMHFKCSLLTSRLCSYDYSTFSQSIAV